MNDPRFYTVALCHLLELRCLLSNYLDQGPGHSVEEALGKTGCVLGMCEVLQVLLCTVREGWGTAGTFVYSQGWMRYCRYFCVQSGRGEVLQVLLCTVRDVWGTAGSFVYSQGWVRYCRYFWLQSGRGEVLQELLFTVKEDEVLQVLLCTVREGWGLQVLLCNQLGVSYSRYFIAQ